MKYNDFFQINEDSLSKSELQIHNYIVSNIKSIQNMNIVDIEQETYLSRATIERYLKKAGTSGFKTFKIKLNEFLHFNNLPITYDDVSKVLLAHRHQKIGITAQGTSFLAAQYMSRRLKFLKFDCQAETFLDLNGVQPEFDLMIVISIRGAKYPSVTDIIDYYQVPLIAITKANSYFANKADYFVDNNAQDNMNLFDIDDVSSTITIIETIIRDIARNIE